MYLAFLFIIMYLFCSMTPCLLCMILWCVYELVVVRVIHYSTVILQLIGPMLLLPLSPDNFLHIHSVHMQYGQQLLARKLAAGLEICCCTGKLANWLLNWLLLLSLWKLLANCYYFWHMRPVLLLMYTFSLSTLYFQGHSYLSYPFNHICSQPFSCYLSFVDTKIHINAQLPSFSYSGSPILVIIACYLFPEKF